MKILITFSLFSLGLLTANNSNVKQDDTNVNAYRLINYGDPNNPDDTTYAYFDKKACADYFQSLYTGWVKGGIVSVPQDQVFMTCDL